MSDKEDQIDSPAGIGLNDLVFNEENQERRSWKFCNSRLPRFGVSLIKLVFFHLDSEE